MEQGPEGAGRRRALGEREEGRGSEDGGKIPPERTRPGTGAGPVDGSGSMVARCLSLRLPPVIQKR